HEGASQADVKLEAQVSVLTSGISEAGLVARYTSPVNMYLATLEGNNGSFSVSIWRIVAGVKTRLTTVAVGSNSGKLRFEVLGSSLKLFFDDVLVLTATDTLLAGAGLGGVRGSQFVTFDDFFLTQ